MITRNRHLRIPEHRPKAFVKLGRSDPTEAIWNIVNGLSRPADQLTRCGVALGFESPDRAGELLRRYPGPESTQRECQLTLDRLCNVDRGVIDAAALAAMRAMPASPGCREAKLADEAWHTDVFPFEQGDWSPPCEGRRYQLLRALYVIMRLTSVDWLTDPALASTSGVPEPLWDELDTVLGNVWFTETLLEDKKNLPLQ